MRVGAIILHYRYWPEVNETINALTRQDHPLEHVLVVDNHSGDGSATKLRARPDVEVLEAPSNGGYAAGMNLGLAAVESRELDAVLLLTHEAALNPEGLGALAAHLDSDPKLGAVGPLLAWRDRPDTVYSAGVRIDPHNWSTHHVGMREPVADWERRGPQPADSLDGAAILLRRTAIEQTGKFNEQYFLYYEEVDYFVRMRREGWTIACVPTAMAYQQPGQPSEALWVRNRLRFVADHAPRQVVRRAVLRSVYDAVGDAAKGRPRGARDRLTGVVAFFSGRPAASLVGRR